MNVSFAIVATEISKNRFVSGFMDVQTDSTQGCIYFRIDVLAEVVNVYTGFEVAELYDFYDEIDGLIEAYAHLYWVAHFYPDQIDHFADNYHNALHIFLDAVED